MRSSYMKGSENAVYEWERRQSYKTVIINIASMLKFEKKKKMKKKSFSQFVWWRRRRGSKKGLQIYKRANVASLSKQNQPLNLNLSISFRTQKKKRRCKTFDDAWSQQCLFKNRIQENERGRSEQEKEKKIHTRSRTQPHEYRSLQCDAMANE